MRIIAILFALLSLTAFQLDDAIWVMSKGGHATYSTTLENGETVTAKAQRIGSILRMGEKQINISIPLRSFEFEESGLIDQFVGEDYLNAKASGSIVFNGSIPKANSEGFDKENTYTMEGELVVAGKTQNTKQKITLVKEGENLKGNIVFEIDLADYGVELDDVMKTQFGEKFTITCDVLYETLSINPPTK